MKTILIADDEPDLLEIVEFSIDSEFEVEIVKAFSGNEAIDII